MSTATRRYDPKPEHRPMPAPFNDLLRTEYDPATDTMWLTGQTKDRPISNGEWGTAGTVAARYDGWSKGPSAPRFVVDFPYKPDTTFMVSFCVAGDLFFAIDCKSAKVNVYDQERGRLLGTLSPGPEVHGQSGWVDFRDGILRIQAGRRLVSSSSPRRTGRRRVSSITCKTRCIKVRDDRSGLPT